MNSTASTEGPGDMAMRLAQTGRTEECDRLIAEFDRLTCQIDKLMSERSSVFCSVSDLTKRIIGSAFGIDEQTASETVAAFRESGFKSKQVQDVVRAVRLELFDDSLPVFRETLCVDLEVEYSELVLLFEHEPSGNCFKVGISIPNELRPSYSYSDRIYGVSVVTRCLTCVRNGVEYYEDDIRRYYDLSKVRHELASLAACMFVRESPDLKTLEGQWESPMESHREYQCRQYCKQFYSMGFRDSQDMAGYYTLSEFLPEFLVRFKEEMHSRDCISD